MRLRKAVVEKVAKTGKQWRVEALMEAMEAVSHIDEARRIVKHLVQATDERALDPKPAPANWTQTGGGLA